MQLSKKIKISLALVCFMILVTAITGFAEKQVICGDGTETNLTGLIDYAAMADVTAYIQRADTSDTSPYFLSNSQSYVPSNIFDSSTSSFWYAGSNNADCLIVDLKRQVPIKVLRWRVKDRSGGVTTRCFVNLRTSADGVTYTEAAKVNNAVVTDGYIDVIYDVPVTARYISYDCYDTRFYGEANRIEVYAEPDDTVSVENLLTTENVYSINSSGCYSSNYEIFSYDGMFSSGNSFVSAETTEKPYIEFILKEPAIITDLLIHTNTTYEESAKNLDIKLSYDGESWFEAASYSGDNTLKQGEFNTIHLEDKNSYKYIRIEKNDSKASYAVGDISIAEMRVVKNESYERFLVDRVNVVLDQTGKVTNVGENVSDIKVIMTHDIDTDTADNNSVILYANDIATDIQPVITGNTMIFLLQDLQGNTDYRLVLKTTLKNEDEIPLEEDYTLIFSTGGIYPAENMENAKIVNAILDVPVEINPNLGMYSETALPEYINDGSVSNVPYLAGGTGNAYFFFDMKNANPVFAVGLSERSLGYSSDSIGAIVAGSLSMPSINEDGSINVTEMETIYEVTSALSGDEVRLIELEDIKRYRYIAVYRSNDTNPMCLTEVGVLAQVSLEMKSEPSVTYTSDRCSVSLDVYSYRDTAFDAYLVLTEFDSSGKVVSVTPKDVEIRKGSNNISTTHTLQNSSNRVSGVLISNDDVPAMLFDGF